MRPSFMERVTMSVVGLAERLVGEEMLTRGIKRPEARKIVAREAGIAPGSLENLSRGRLKHHDRITAKLHVLLVRKIEQRIDALQHELFLAREAGRADPVDLDRAEAAIQEARKALGKQ